MRNMYLSQEYQLRGQMDRYEGTIQSLMSDISRYNFIELYHEENYIKEQVKSITNDLKEFNIYMPKYQLKIQDIQNAVSQIKTDIKDRLQSYF
jgi:predicted  nucleic acid-binding Zn-ribbon protein